MAAITWQNINGPSLAGAAAPLSGAQDSFKDMFGSFENILKQRLATETANWDQGKLNNTNALLSAVQGAKTPEEYAVLEAGLREQMAGYGAQVDATAARSAMDVRMGTLQQRAKQAGEFADWTTDREQAPVRDELMAAVNRNDPLTANIIKSGNPQLRNMAAIEAAQAAVQRQATSDGYAQSDQRMQEALHPGALALQTAQVEASKAATAAKAADTNAKGFTNNASNMLNGYRQNQAALVEGGKRIAKEMNIPVDPVTGNIMPSLETGQTAEVMAKFNARLTKEYGTSTTPSQMLEGMANYLTTTNLSTAEQNKILKDAGDSLTDTNMLAPSDKDKVTAFESKTKTARESVLKNNPWYGAEQDKTEGITRVLKQADGVKDWTVNSIPAGLQEYMTKGFKHNGKTVVIPPKVLEEALAIAGGVQKETTIYNNTLTKVENALTTILSDPKTQGLIEQAGMFDNTEAQNKGKFQDSLKLPATPAAHQKAISEFEATLLKRAANPPK